MLSLYEDWREERECSFYFTTISFYNMLNQILTLHTYTYINDRKKVYIMKYTIYLCNNCIDLDYIRKQNGY